MPPDKPAVSYGLYLESGPQQRKTMVHVLDLLGCVAVGPTTDAALAATPEAIRLFRRFMRRHGEPVDAEASFTTHVVEHVMQGTWLGNGSPYLTFGPDLEPLGNAELERLAARFQAIRETLAAWAEGQPPERLDLLPEGGGRPARGVLLHVLTATGGYLSSALGGAPGFHRVGTQTERGELSLADGLRRVGTMAAERIRATSPRERTTVRQLPTGRRTLRKALRRMLEHDWEHLAELSRRPGGPVL